ncbi:MAG: hypothetical protein AB8F95_05720 [Bacteroidia bacterium]
MQKSRLIQHLKVLTAHDWKQFSLYVASPFFNQNKRVIILVDYLQTCAPDFDQEKLLKKLIYPILFPEAPDQYTSQPVHDHFSMVLRLLEGYFCQEAIMAKADQNEVMLNKALLKRGLKRPFDRRQKRFFAENDHAANLEAFYWRFQLQLEVYNRAQISRDPGALDLLLAADQALNRCFMAYKLKLGSERFNRQRIFKNEQSPKIDKLMEAGLEELELFSEDPLLTVYGMGYALYAQPEDVWRYDALVNLLGEVAGRFKKDEALDAYVIALNYAIRRFNEGDESFIERIFLLYKRILDLGLLMRDDSYFPHSMMKNIVTAGLRNKAFDWTKEYIESYVEKVEPALRNDVYAYNMAMYHFEQNRYREALRGLSQTKFKDVFYELGARTLQVKIYFEMGEDDSIGYLLKAFRAALKRNKAVSATYFKAFDDFTRFVDKVYKLKMTKGVAKQENWDSMYEQLNTKLSSTESAIADVTWLRDKLAELA